MLRDQPPLAATCQYTDKRKHIKTDSVPSAPQAVSAGLMSLLGGEGRVGGFFLQ